MATLKSDLSHFRVSISIPEMKKINKENTNQHFGQAGEHRGILSPSTSLLDQAQNELRDIG
jgi:hypothetical protein